MPRQRKYTNSSVISFRISDEELESLNNMVNALRVPRSDVVRLALGVVVGSPVTLARNEPQGLSFHGDTRS